MDSNDDDTMRYLCLSIAKNTKLLEKLDNNENAAYITEEFDIGMTTTCGLKKQKDMLLKFYSECDEVHYTQLKIPYGKSGSICITVTHVIWQSCKVVRT